MCCCGYVVFVDISPATPVITTKLTFFEDAQLLVSELVIMNGMTNYRKCPKSSKWTQGTAVKRATSGPLGSLWSDAVISWTIY